MHQSFDPGTPLPPTAGGPQTHSRFTRAGSGAEICHKYSAGKCTVGKAACAYAHVPAAVLRTLVGPATTWAHTPLQRTLLQRELQLDPD